MKIFILKLLSLVVILMGTISLLVAIGVPQVREYWDMVPGYLTQAQELLPEQLSGLKSVLTINAIWFGASVLAIVLGAYGFWPKGKKFRRRKKIAYEGPHGEVQIQLDTVEQSLNQVLARMPEIKKIDLRVDPHDGGKKALIRANVVIYQQPGQNARAIAALVSDYIAETATKLLGLEELATIDLNVVGISVNTRKSSKAVRKESLSHSANAPVELLEAAPAPLSLSGPNSDPIGSESIEEELEEEAENENAMEASAVDTRKEEEKQAAARSELLEPLHMGDTASRAEVPVAAAPEVQEEAVSPRDMDVLDESLDTPEEEDPELAGDDFLPEEEAAEMPAEFGEDEPQGSEVEERAVEEMTEPGTHADADYTEESATGGDETPDLSSRPWASATGPEAEQAFPAAEEGNTSPDESDLTPDSDAAEEVSTAEIPDPSEMTDNAELHDTDSVMGEPPSEVTIPEQSEDAEAPADESEKKRWGSWFN